MAARFFFLNYWKVVCVVLTTKCKLFKNNQITWLSLNFLKSRIFPDVVLKLSLVDVHSH